MSEELSVLLMGYLDGELDENDRARVEAALEKDPDLRREYDEMARLKEITRGLDDVMDTELDGFWNEIYNNLERNTAWVLLLAGMAGLLAIAAFFFFTASTHWGLKTAGACAAAGSALLLWSVWRERQRVLRHDRYTREVHR